MYPIGTKVRYQGENATITEIDYDDFELPYLIERTAGYRIWVSPSAIVPETIAFIVTDEQIQAVDASFAPDGDPMTTLYKVSSTRTANDLRERVQSSLDAAAHYEALARLVEANPVDPDEEAKAIYYEAYPKDGPYNDWDETTEGIRLTCRKLAQARK